MRCLADLELVADLCFIDSYEAFNISHQSGRFEFYVKNLTSTELDGQMLLSAQIIFDAENIEAAEDLSKSLLAEVLNALAFVTNAGFTLHRLVKIVDWTSGIDERQVLFFTSPKRVDPSAPLLERVLLESAELMLSLELDSPVKSAMRWFRLGVGADVLEEQFQYFWFALEIIAEIKKPTEKVYDACPKCQSPLFCEACKTHPDHRPFPKQAIEHLVSKITGDQSGEVFHTLNTVRNTLMHGRQLQDAEPDLPYESYKVVDKLGKIVWNSLASILPAKYAEKRPVHLLPNTYIRHELTAAVHATIKFPKGPNGQCIEFIRNLKPTVEIVRN